MKQFNFDYDEENDDLFVYLPDSKSSGAVEIGDFVFDFDENEKLVSIEIIEASKVLSKMLSRIIEISKIKEMKAEVVNFRNMAFISIEIKFDSGKEKINIHIPRVKEESPALSY